MAKTNTVTVMVEDGEKIVWSFNGRFKLASTRLANMAMVFLGATEEQATRFGMAFASDLGQVKSAETDVVLGKFSTDGEWSGKLVDAIEKQKQTPAISIAKLLVETDKLRKLGMLYTTTTIGMITKLNDWFYQLGEYAVETTASEDKVKEDLEALGVA